jgi:hypothetical protein
LARSGDNATDEIPSANERLIVMRKKDMRKQIAYLKQEREHWVERHRRDCADYRANVEHLMGILNEYERMNSMWDYSEANK